MAGLVPAISLRDAMCRPKRDHRDKPGDDRKWFQRCMCVSTAAVGQQSTFNPFVF
jgi:hypothetical protein